jgi:hypothetical protein
VRVDRDALLERQYRALQASSKGHIASAVVEAVAQACDRARAVIPELVPGWPTDHSTS